MKQSRTRMAGPVCYRQSKRRLRLNRFSLRTVVPVVAAALASLIAASALAQTGTVADGFSEVTARPAAAHNYWTSGAPLPTAVTYQMTGVIAGKIYNVGGHSTKGDN